MKLNYVEKGSSPHRCACHRIARKFRNKGIPEGLTMALASKIPTGIMEVDDDKNLITTSQINITINCMVEAFKMGSDIPN